jgi:uncharacterized SAM-binding protein YcdF (DUF218 family)
VGRDRRRFPIGARLSAAAIVVVLLLAAGSRAGSALVVARDVPAPDALVALASHEWERLPALARLASGAPEAVVLLTQPVQPSAANCHLCAERVSWLQALGVTSDRVVVLPRRVGNTRDEAMAVAAYRATHPLGRLVVVTSPYHTRRALAVFASVLGGSVRLGVHPATERSPAKPDRWWRASYDRAYVAYEWTALAWYVMRYGVNPLIPSDAGGPDAKGIGRL